MKTVTFAPHVIWLIVVFCILVTADLHISAVNSCDSEMLICICISYLVNTFFEVNNLAIQAVIG